MQGLGIGGMDDTLSDRKRDWPNIMNQRVSKSLKLGLPPQHYQESSPQTGKKMFSLIFLRADTVIFPMSNAALVPHHVASIPNQYSLCSGIH